MKYLFCFLLFLKFSSPDSISKKFDYDNLYQNWKFSKYEASNKNEITYKSSSDFGNYYGYQFRRNGKFTVSRGVSDLPRNIQNDYEEIDGTWKIKSDSILHIQYKSNNRNYNYEFVIRNLDSQTLVLHSKHTY